MYLANALRCKKTIQEQDLLQPWQPELLLKTTTSQVRKLKYRYRLRREITQLQDLIRETDRASEIVKSANELPVRSQIIAL